MSAPTIKCPSGHVNSANQKFCGECGLSLAGVCPNGHQNPAGQRYCGECGSPLGQQSSSLGDLHSSAAGEPESRNASRPPAPQAPIPTHAELPRALSPTCSAPTKPKSRDAGSARRALEVGDRLQMAHGIDAVVVKFDVFDTVWLDVTKDETHHGMSKWRRRDVEKSLAEGRIAVAGCGAEESVPDGGRAVIRTGGGTESLASQSLNGTPSPPSAPAGSTDGIQAWWAKLPTWGKGIVVAAPAALLLIFVLIATLGGGKAGRDQQSYDYGRTEVVGWAFPLWEGALTNPQAVPKIRSERDACRFSVEIARDNITPAEMLRLDDGDIIDGCTDELTRLSRKAGLRS